MKILSAILAGVAVFAGVIFTFMCVEKVPTGYVGVVYSMSGGVNGEVLPQGWHLVSPTKKVKEFTIGNEQIILSKDSREGSKEDESFAVATSDNANIDISFQMSYRFRQENIVNTFKNFRGMSGEDIVNNRVKTVLKAKISEVTTNYSMMDLYSGNRSEINFKLTESLNEELGKQYGLEIIDASIIDVHPDAQLQKTIDERVAAVQARQKAMADKEKLAVENETKIQQAEAAAKEQQIKANADAEILRINAEAEAEAIRINAEAEADAYNKIANAITPELINLKKMEKWDGKLPEVTGSESIIKVEK